LKRAPRPESPRVSADHGDRCVEACTAVGYRAPDLISRRGMARSIHRRKRIQVEHRHEMIAGVDLEAQLLLPRVSAALWKSDIQIRGHASSAGSTRRCQARSCPHRASQHACGEHRDGHCGPIRDMSSHRVHARYNVPPNHEFARHRHEIIAGLGLRSARGRDIARTEIQCQLAPEMTLIATTTARRGGRLGRLRGGGSFWVWSLGVVWLSSFSVCGGCSRAKTHGPTGTLATPGRIFNTRRAHFQKGGTGHVTIWMPLVRSLPHRSGSVGRAAFWQLSFERARVLRLR